MGLSLMMWNWQQPDWPHFSWEPARIHKEEEHFLLGGGSLSGILRHLTQLGTGKSHHRSDRQRSRDYFWRSKARFWTAPACNPRFGRQLGLAGGHRQSKPAEEGIAEEAESSEMMVDLYRTSSKPLSNKSLFGWHRMLFRGRTSLRDIGRYRTGDDPMEVISGPLHSPRVHFEAPPSTRVAEEMARFVEWFHRTSPSGAEPLSALTRAGTAHLYFESIHPFEDGNGRIGRAIAEKALAQAFGQPTLTALSAIILRRRKAYYAALEAANKHNEVTEWLCGFASIAIEAQKLAIANADFLIEKTRLLDRLRGQLNSRQEKALHRMLREGPEGFKGGMSAGNYSAITGASPATTTRDLADLVDLGALRREGERRHARYHVTIVEKID